MPLLLVIEGPTGVGKTEVALQVAERLQCPIVNADSRQIYRELPIGTAAPTAEAQARVKHYFVATHSITEAYNAGQYERDALSLLSELFKEKEVVVLTGGSMMYVSAVLHGFDDLPDISLATRAEVKEMYETGGIERLQDELRRLDPAYCEQVDMRNPQRLMHAIEVTKEAGVPYSTLRSGKREKREFNILRIALNRPREELYERINKRVDMMIEQGMISEAKAVFEQLLPTTYDLQPTTYAPLPNSLNTVGYKELYRYLIGEWTKEEAIAMIKQNSRRYAKRQLTWLRHEDNIQWINISDYETTKDIVDAVLAYAHDSMHQ